MVVVQLVLEELEEVLVQHLSLEVEEVFLDKVFQEGVIMEVQLLIISGVQIF